jgi:hypothetical protein
LQANFVASPFTPVTGTYNGLFYEADQVRQASAGALALTVSTHGKYSGRVQIGNSRYSFSGKLSLNCLATNLLKRPKTNPLTLHLRVGTNGQIDQVFGDLSDGSWLSEVSGDRAIFNSRTNPAAAAGVYTLVLPGSFDSAFPQGHSFGTLKVSSAGRVTFAGALSDGSRVTQGATLSKNKEWPLYASLYSGQGLVLSWLTFSNQTDSDVSGNLSWIKLANSKARYFASGFDYLTPAAGSAFQAPSSTNKIVHGSIVAVDFSGGDLPATFSNLINLGPGSKVTNLSSNKLSLSFTLSTGLYHGSVTDPSTGHASTFSGAVFQKVNMGYGFLLGKNRSSGVEIAP